MIATPGFQNVYGAERDYVLIPSSDLPPERQRQYRAFYQGGLDTRSLMQVALAYSRPTHLSIQMLPVEDLESLEEVINLDLDVATPVDQLHVIDRLRNLLHQSDHLIGSTRFHQTLHQLLDFAVVTGPILRQRLEFYSGKIEYCANVERAEADFVIVGFQSRLPEHPREFILSSGPSSQFVL